MKKLLRYSLGVMLLTSVSFAQNVAKKTTVNTKEKVQFKERGIPSNSNVFDFNINVLQSKLSTAPMRGEFYGKSNTIIELPAPNGEMVAYRIQEAPVFAPDLQAKYPEIRSYAGYAVNDESSYLRFTVSPYNGVNGIVLTADRSESIVLQSVSSIDISKTAIFRRSDRKTVKSFECDTDETLNVSLDDMDYSSKAADDATLREYDLAMSVTGEYSAYHGGTLATVNAAIATTVTRQNSVYEMEFAITLVLIGTNDNVIFLNAATDPYGPDDSGYNGELQAALDMAPPTGVGSAAYDIGHLMSAIGNNGNAGCIGCICVAGQKGSGFTTSTVPIGDNFDIDFVAHEMGHQFGANHTHTHGANEGTNVQVEPGSGSTIMGYAGITGATDVQAHSDPYFHAVNITQVTAHAKTRGCDVETATGNTNPVANAGANITLPVGTPFKLTGAGSDADGDTITYCWEQIDEDNVAGAYPDATSTSNNKPSFRSYSPSTNPVRTFPELNSLLNDGFNGATWEKVPTVGRSADFRLTVRDNRAGGAANVSDDMIVTWDASKGPLAVTSQAAPGVVWNNGNTETITWDVNSTDTMAGASNVDILLSLDGGLTYPTTLASNVTNNGTYDITVPNSPAPYCRVMVQPTGAPFFSINTVDFAIDYTIATVCTQYSSGTINLAIPDGQPAGGSGGQVSNSINVPATGVITDINVNVDINHSWVRDLVFSVTHPDATNVVIANRLCNGQVAMDVTFDDAGPAIVCGADGTTITGTYAPSSVLSAFNGKPANGNWTITLEDMFGVDTGQLNNWYVEVCVNVETPLTVEENQFSLFNIYPNPSNGNVNIALSSSEDVQISLHDIRGRQVYSKLHNNNSVSFNKTIDFSAVASGVYLLNVESGAKKATKKLVIQ